jgi:uncharacterized protein YjcR
MEEILNVDYHRCRLILKSLNTSKTIKEASEKCGISTKTMHIWKQNYGIKKTKDNKYERKVNPWLVKIS